MTAVVGFEVIGSRYRSDGELGEGSLYGSYADHIANGCIVVGDPIAGWQEVVFEDTRLRVTEDERELAAVVGCHPFDNPFLPVVVAINHLRCEGGPGDRDQLVDQLLPGADGGGDPRCLRAVG